MPDSVIDLRQFLIYLRRKANPFIKLDLSDSLRSYNESTSFYRKMMRFFEDRNMMDTELLKPAETHSRSGIGYWTTHFGSQNGSRIKFVGEVSTQCSKLRKKLAFLLKTSVKDRKARSDKYIRGEKLKYSLISNRNRKILLKGPSFSGECSKVRTQYIEDYSRLNLTYLNHKMDRIDCFNLIKRQSTSFANNLGGELLNYDLTRRIRMLAGANTLIFRNRITELIENKLELAGEICTSFAWNANWYLILPKYGNSVELFGFRTDKMVSIKFEKMGHGEAISFSSKVVPSESIDVNLGCMRIEDMLFVVTNGGGISVVDLENRIPC